ncbi:MAG: hypothetical protein A2284_08505 [Deltaproteobacteria bacterium RIFOXYA12_FULL_61_11]|nr:MAG: hypothetical protein A2284_08505 [Deltaproteobacteria bacterium RIFOXYA12_FULL_61_11]
MTSHPREFNLACGMNGQHRGDNLMQPKGHTFLRYSNLVTGTQPLRHLLACCLGGLFVLGCTLELGALTKGDEDPAPASAKDVETDQAGPERDVASAYVRTWQHHEAMYSRYYDIDSDGNVRSCRIDTLGNPPEAQTCTLDHDLLTCPGEEPQTLSMDGSHLSISSTAGTATYGKLDAIPSECPAAPDPPPLPIDEPQDPAIHPPEEPDPTTAEEPHGEADTAYVGTWQHHEAMYSSFYTIAKDGTVLGCVEDKVGLLFSTYTCRVFDRDLRCDGRETQTLSKDGSHLVLTGTEGPKIHGRLEELPAQCR